MDVVGTQDWADFESAISTDAQDTFFKEIIVWRRTLTNLDRWKEDNLTAQTNDVQLKCLINYNFPRSWPVTGYTETGEIDKESMQVLFVKKYLRDLGFIDSNGLFIYNEDLDYFYLNGLKYKPSGDTDASQANTDALIVAVIMLRQKPDTGNKR